MSVVQPMEEEGEAGSLRGSVDVSEGEGAYEDANIKEDEKASAEGLVFQEDSNFEQQGASGEKPAEPEGSISQNPLGKMDANVENTPMLTPEKLQPEFVNCREILIPNNETEYLKEKFLDHESTPHHTVTNRQESIECRSFMESDDYAEFAPTDNVSEMSTSVKNYLTVDDEGATPQFDEKEIVGKESEDDVMEIAERLSQLRSIGKTAESARKYILGSDMEVLDSNDHMSDLLGPKRLDFEVIDFDQFGAQPPDFPLNRSSRKVNHHGGISCSNGGKRAVASTKAKKPDHHVRVLDAPKGFEQEMKGLNDSPVKRSSKNTPEKKQLRKEHGAGALDLHADHVIPRLCNMANVKGSGGQDISRDLDSSSIAGGNGNSKPRVLDSMKPKKVGEAPSGSPIKRLKSSMTDAKGSLVHEETRKRTEELQQLTQMQAKRLEDYCHRVDLCAAQLEEQSRMREELHVKLEAECGERLKSEAKLMVFCEMLPNVEGKLKNLCDQTLFMEVQVQEQLELRNKLEAALEREHQKRMHFVARLEKQVDLRNKLGEDLEQERQERLQLAANLEEQVDLRNKLGEDLEQERQERLQLAANLEEQVDLRNKLGEDLEQERKERTSYVAQLEEQIRLHGEIAHKLEVERDERLKSDADLMVLREMLPNIEEKLEDLNNLVESLVVQLQEQTNLREALNKKFDQERKERIKNLAKTEDHFKMHAELAQKVEEGRDERLRTESCLKELCERLPCEEEKLKDLQHQVLSLAGQLQEQMELRKELEERLDSEREKRIQYAVIMSNHASGSLPVSSIPWSQENVELAKFLDEQQTFLANQVKEAEILENAPEKRVGLLDHQVQNLEVVSESAETLGCVFSAKERVIKQALWTVFQALCLGMGLMNFIVSVSNPVRSFLQPT